MRHHNVLLNAGCAERGLPAMYRGRQVVVSGDDKQLKPNDLYKIRWEDENEDDIPELEVDSLLNLAKQAAYRVPSAQRQTTASQSP